MDQDGDWAPGLQKAKTYEQLLLDIILGVLPPGAPVDERKLAARYEVGLAGVRDALGRLALEGLVADGRIHPASVEEFVARAREEMGLTVQQAGEEAVQRLGVNGLHPEIIKQLGRLKYRFSLAQNVLEHSVEVGFLCSMLASELGLDPNVAKRAGLLHDLGKGVEGDYQGSHATIGADFVRRHGETPIVVNAVAAHHEEV